MPDVTSSRSFVVAVLFLAAGTWWLANTSLQASIGYANVPAVATQAAFVLVLGQALLTGLLAVHNAPDKWPAAALDALSFVVPVWPLLALMWLTSGLSMFAIAVSQLAAFVLAITAGSAGRRISRLAISVEARAMLRGATGTAIAAAVWIGRGELHAWITT